MSLDYHGTVPVGSVRDEHDYLAAHPCPLCGGQWRIRMQALLQDARGRHFDRVDVVCRQCGERRIFFFDIEALFTKKKADC